MDRKMVNFIKEQYPPGTRIRLNSMEDPYAPILPGTEGEVDFVDDAGQLHMKWDNGRTLALVPGEDSFSVLPPKLTTLKLYMPLTADLYERNEYGDFDDCSILLEGRELRGYQDQIKEITSAGHLSARNFSFGDEIIESDGKLNFYVQTEFDVDAAFGTFVLTDENDDWLNVYANYDIAEDRPCDTLELTLCKGDGSEESWSYPLNAAEQDVLLRKMEEYCQKQTGMSLHDYAQQFREEPEQQQGPVMKL